MKTTISLQCLPPATPESPSCSLSYLKSNLIKKGYNVNIFYWNLHLINLQKKFVGSEIQKDCFTNNSSGIELLLFQAWQAVKTKNTRLYREVRLQLTLQQRSPVLLQGNHLDYHISYYIRLLDEQIESLLNRPELLTANCFFIANSETSPFFPILIEKLSKRGKIILTHSTNKKDAVFFLKKHPALSGIFWGKNLSSFSNFIIASEQNNQIQKEIIYDFIVRKKEEYKIIPDFSDYFKQKAESGNESLDCAIPIRAELLPTSVKAILQEVIQQIKQTNISFLTFTITNLSEQVRKYEELLNELILISRTEDNMALWDIKIKLSGIDSQIIRQLSLLACNQIIPLPTSRNKKMICELIYLIKLSEKYSIPIQLQPFLNLLSEEEWINLIECLPFIKFQIQKGYILPIAVTKDINKSINPHFFSFQSVYNLLQSNRYDYQLYEQDDYFLYKEIENGKLIKEYEFLKDSIEWFILKVANNHIITYDELKTLLKTERQSKLLDIEYVQLLEELKEEGLIYTTENLCYIITTIDTSKIS